MGDCILRGDCGVQELVGLISIICVSYRKCRVSVDANPVGTISITRLSKPAGRRDVTIWAHRYPRLSHYPGVHGAIGISEEYGLHYCHRQILFESVLQEKVDGLFRAHRLGAPGAD